MSLHWPPCKAPRQHTSWWLLCCPSHTISIARDRHYLRCAIPRKLPRRDLHGEHPDAESRLGKGRGVFLACATRTRSSLIGVKGIPRCVKLMRRFGGGVFQSSRCDSNHCRRLCGGQKTCGAKISDPLPLKNAAEADSVATPGDGNPFDLTTPYHRGDSRDGTKRFLSLTDAEDRSI
jgi:hypothetical protein